MQPISAIDKTKNPVTGEVISLPDTMFAITGEISMADDASPEPRLQIEEPYYRFGEDIHLVMLDIRKGEGPHQPRLDSYLYKVNENDLRNPLVKTVDAQLSYGALMRASVFRWMKFPKDSETQVFSLRAGFKTNDAAKIPALIRTTILSDYPDRV